MGHPKDKDDTSDHDLLLRIDERVLTTRNDVREIKADQKATNDRVLKVEVEQGRIRGRMNLLGGLGALVTGIFGTIVALVKQP